MCALTARGHRRRPRARRVAAPRHSAKSDGPDPDRLQPSAPASTAARLIAARPGHERRAARLGDRVLERARDQREVAAVQAVDERAEVRPLPDRVGERHRVAEQRARLRRLDLEIGMHDDRRQARRAPAAGRCRADSARRTSTKPPQMRRRDVVGVRRSGAEPLAFERAGDQRLDATRARRAARRRRRPPRRRWPRCRRARSTAAAPCGCVSATPRRSPSVVSSASAATPAVLLRRLARQPAAVADDVVDARRRAAREARGHLVARRVEREAEHVEAARDVRHGRRRKRGRRTVMSGSSG